MDLKELSSGIEQTTHWYYQSKKNPLFHFIREVLQKEKKSISLIDIGAGSGFFSNQSFLKYKEYIDKVYQCDIEYKDEELAKTSDERILRTRSLPSSISNSIIIMMDVLEHIENDKEFLKDIFSRCKGNHNYFFITVPAFKNIWSGHDEYLGHFRRYEIKTLKKLLDRQEINDIGYIFGSLYPLAFIIRKLKGNKKPFPSLINKILLYYFTWENKLIKSNKLFGLSCMANGKVIPTKA